MSNVSSIAMKVGAIIAISYAVIATIVVGALANAHNAREAARNSAFQAALDHRSSVADGLIYDRSRRLFSSFESAPEYRQADTYLDEVRKRTESERTADLSPGEARGSAVRVGLLLMGVYAVAAIALSKRPKKTQNPPSSSQS